ncbi:Xaa-Pro peptidase family protein [Puniceicoccaceae bacterium K14]|nr:Xaa-Pro peptidase family protein [Puniceicoccaceae bacterium K14]
MPKSKNRKRSVPLVFADTHKSADQLYVGKFSVPDPFISFKKGRKWYAVLNQLEYARALKESAFDEVLPLEDWLKKATGCFPSGKVGYVEIIATLAQAFKFEAFKVASDFPAGIALGLIEKGLAVNVSEGSLFPEREIKSEKELQLIKEGNGCSAAGIRAAEQALKDSVIKKGKLYLEGKALTSERLREVIEIACLRKGSLSMDTIAAAGAQACDPHCAGHGPIRANELIIVDVFPRVSKSGYFGDMTRTFLKGTPSDDQSRLVSSVNKVQKEAIKAVKVGVKANSIHQHVMNRFISLGYETRRDKSGAVGFIHGTGHGLGLEVHEAPRVSIADNRLKENAVITIEPGLYYPEIGGCRIEDVVAVGKEKPIKLSSYHYNWVIA